MNKVYTIGYSAFKIETFIEILKQYGIKCLIDVRSVPRSKHFQDFNSENLERFLKQHKILYRNYAEEFGARQTDKKFFTDGVLDFEKFSKSQQFLAGIRKIEKGMDMGFTFTLMCAEKRPEICHRCILVGRQFHKRGYEVRNILDDGNYIKQDEVEKILVDEYFPRKSQLSLFERDDICLSIDEKIHQSYVKRGKEIGYRLEKNFDEEDFHDWFH